MIYETQVSATEGTFSFITMIEFILASNLNCAGTADVIDRVKANLDLSSEQQKEVVMTLIEFAPEGCVLEYNVSDGSTPH